MISSVDGGSVSISSLQAATSNTTTANIPAPKTIKGTNNSAAKSTQGHPGNGVKGGDSGAIVKSTTAEQNNGVNSSSQSTEANQSQLLGNYGNNTDEAYYLKTVSDVPSSFQELAVAVGAAGGRVTKEQLKSYLQSLTLTSASGSTSVSVADITLVKNLIAQFTELSGGTGYITSLKGANEAQDYTTVTSDQVTLPIDIRV